MRDSARGCGALVQHVDWYFWSNGLFLLGILGDMGDTLFDYYNPQSEGSRLVALLAVIAWIVSAVVDLGRCLVDQHNRRLLSAAVQVSCWPTRDSPNKIFSFAMLGALLFMFANFFYLAAETSCWYEEDADPRSCNALELSGATFFIFNAIAAFLEYRQRHTMDLSMSVYKGERHSTSRCRLLCRSRARQCLAQTKTKTSTWCLTKWTAPTRRARKSGAAS